jgi:hypothetical protein
MFVVAIQEGRLDESRDGEVTHMYDLIQDLRRMQRHADALTSVLRNSGRGATTITR